MNTCSDGLEQLEIYFRYIDPVVDFGISQSAKHDAKIHYRVDVNKNLLSA